MSGKLKWGFALLTLVFAGLIVFLVMYADKLQQPPLQQEIALDNVSRVTTDSAGNLYVIHGAMQEIVSLDEEGTLRYTLKQPSRAEGQTNYTEVAVDDRQRLYVLNTQLDSYGLYVEAEHIDRYSPDGQFETRLFEWEGDGSSKRIGQLRGLMVENNQLSFFILRAETIQQQRLQLDSRELSVAFQFEVPQNRYLSEISGQAGEVRFTTKRGSIYEVNAAGESVKIYPVEGGEQTSRNFPERLKAGADGRFYFVDRLTNSLTAVPSAQLAEAATQLDSLALASAAPEADSTEIIDYIRSSDGSTYVALADRLLLFDTQGSYNAEITGARYSGSQRLFHALVWGAALVASLLLIVIARIFYVHVLHRRISFFLKQAVTFIPLILIAMVFLSYTIYTNFSARMAEEMQRELSVLAQSGKHIIEGDRLERLQSPEDYRSEDYLAIKTRMAFLFEDDNPADRRGLYSTLYKYEAGQLFIIADDDDGVNMFTPFPLNEENILVVEQGKVIAGSWSDSNGSWTYAIAPVYNSAGTIVGIYETGRDMNVLEQENQQLLRSIMQNIVLMTAILVAVFLLITFILLSSLRKLRASVLDIVNGNWNAEVKISSRDEIGDLSEQFNLMVRHIQQYIKDITAFSEASYRFVPQQFFKYLGKRGIQDIHLGDQVQENMVLMVSRIRAFEQMSKRLTPKENFNFMNSFLSRFGPLVRREDGLISNYLGAGFMSLFPNRPEDALRAAIEIRKELFVYNGHRQKVGYPPVDIGIAVHKGPLMLGIVGEESRMEGNVISDDVNLTAVLQQMSETLGVSVLATKSLIDTLREPERFKFRSLGRVRIEGKGEALELFDVYEGDVETVRKGKDKTKALFERGILLYQQGRFFDAREAFVEVIKWNRMDTAAKLYFYLCDEYYQQGTTPDWNGSLAVS